MAASESGATSWRLIHRLGKRQMTKLPLAKVVRTRSTANSQEFRCVNGKHVAVHFNASNHHTGGYNPGYGAGT
jgi:hypothetical protein